MGIPDLSGAIIRDPMLEVKAFSEGINQQRAIGTTFSNAVKGFEEGQAIASKSADIENQQQTNASNAILLEKQQEALQYYPQQLAIENAERQIDFANKTVGMDEAAMTSLVGADDATKYMNITRAARAQVEQFQQADPVQQETLFTSPDFAGTLAQNPTMQKLLLPKLNQLIAKREAAGDVVGVRELTSLYGHGVVPGVYEPKFAEKGAKTEAQLNAEKQAQADQDAADYKRGAELLSPEELQNAQSQGSDSITQLGRQARLKEQGNGDASLATPTKSSVPNTSSTIPAAQDPSTNPNKVTPSTDPTATPTESPNPEVADTIVNVAPQTGADASSTTTIARQSTKPRNVPTHTPNPNYSTYADNKAAYEGSIRENGIAPDKEDLKLFGQVTKEALKEDVKQISLLQNAHQARANFVNQLDPIIRKLDANPMAKELLGKAMTAGRDIEGALTYVRGAAGVGSEGADVINLLAQLKGAATQGLLNSGLKATQLNTEKEIQLWLSSTFTTDFGIDTLKEKLNVLKTNLHESEVMESAFQFAKRNANANADIGALTQDYLKYEYVKGLSPEERKAKGLPPITPDEAQLETVKSPDEFFNSMANAEHAKRRDASIEIIQRKQRELNDTSRIDAHQSPVNGVQDTDISKITYSPEHQEHAKVLARVDPVAYHDLYVQNSKGNAQMAAFGSAADAIQATVKLNELQAEGVLNRNHLDALDKAGIKIDLTTAAFQAPELLRIVAIESNGSAKAKSPKQNSADLGYEGIGQLGRRSIVDGFQDFDLVHKGRDADHLTIQDITDIRGDKTSSLIAMSGFLNGRWSKQYPDKVARLAYYNGGAPQANAYMKRKNINDIPSKETREYLKLVIGENHFTPKSIPTVQEADFSPNQDEARVALASDPSQEMGDTIIGRFNKEHPVPNTEKLSPHDQLVKNKREGKAAPNPLDSIYNQTNEQLLDPENPIYKEPLIPDPRNLEFPVSLDSDKRKQATAIATERMIGELMQQGHDHPVATFATSAVLSALNMAALGGGDKFLAALVSKGDLLNPGDYQQSYNMIKEMHNLYNTTSMSGYIGARVGDVVGILASTPGLAIAGVKSTVNAAMALSGKIAPEITADVARGAEEIARVGIEYLNKHGAPGAARLFQNLTIGAGEKAAQKEIIKRTMMDRAATIAKGSLGGTAAGAASAEPGHEAGGAAAGTMLGFGISSAIEAIPATVGFIKSLAAPSAAKTIAKDSQTLGVPSTQLNEVAKGVEPGSLPSDIGDDRIGAMAAKANEAAVASEGIATTAKERLATQGQEGIDVVTEAAQRAPEQVLKESADITSALAQEIKTKVPNVENATKILESGGDEATKLLSAATGIEYAGKNAFEVQKLTNEKFDPLFKQFKDVSIDPAQVEALVNDHPIIPEVIDKVNGGKTPENLYELLNVEKRLREIKSNRLGGNAATAIPYEKADEALTAVDSIISAVDTKGSAAAVRNQYRIQKRANDIYEGIYSADKLGKPFSIEEAIGTRSKEGVDTAKQIGIPETKIKEVSTKQKEAKEALKQAKVLESTAQKIENKGGAASTDLASVLTEKSGGAKLRKALDDAGVKYGDKIKSQKSLTALSNLNNKLKDVSKTAPIDVGKIIRDLPEDDAKAIKNLIGKDAYEGMQTAADHLSNRAKTNQLLAKRGEKIDMTDKTTLPWQLLSNPITAKGYSLFALLKVSSFSPTAKRELAEAFFSGDVDKMKKTWENAAKLLKGKEESIKLQNLFSDIVGGLSAREVQSFNESGRKQP